MTDSVPLSDEPFENQEILENLLLSEEVSFLYQPLYYILFMIFFFN